MIVLATDTSGEHYTVAVCDGEALVAETTVRGVRKHCEKLIQTVAGVLDDAAMTLNDIELLAVSVGPGSFTGIRVGVAAWKGIALGRGLPLVGVSTLDGLARSCGVRQGTLGVLIDAKMGEVYGAAYRVEDGRPEKLGPERVGSIETVTKEIEGPAAFVGDGAALYRDEIEARLNGASFLPPISNIPRASAIAWEGLARVRRGVATDPAHVTAVYLRKSQAEQARDAKLKLETASA